jgi:serine/threonine protein phosphatase 1
MESERVFIVGDIHGCLGPLKRLMDKIDWHPDADRLIFLGDYLDRGENSKGVVDFILELSKRSRLVECLIGNHENIFLKFLTRGELQNFLANGGRTTLESYRLDGKRHSEPFIPPDHMDFFQNLLLWIELEDYYVVHAGFRPEVEIEKQSLDDLIWIREPFIYSDYDFGKKVIFGHTPFSKPLVTDDKIGLDTGAVFGNRLTCLEIPLMKFHSVEA